jgi:hypothetical protein
VNYFGHAAVASWRAGATDELAGLALGAMLPDFAGMCGARVAGAADAAIARGIELHHDTDAVFHHAPAVLALFRDAEARLAAGGCRRGPMRAAAHVGVELLLDGTLLDEPAHRAAYTAALAHDTTTLTWRDPADPARFAALFARIRGYGLPDDLRRPASAAERIFRALSGRRLLEPSSAERVVIAAVLADLAPRVAVARDTILRQVTAGLAVRIPDKWGQVPVDN